MDSKAKLLELFVEKLLAQHAVIVTAAKEAHNAAIHSESKAEDQYDTRGLEASYLAGAQSRRLGDIEKTLIAYQTTDYPKFDDQTPIACFAYVELLNEEGTIQRYLVMASGGGMTVDWQGNKVHSITPESPIGEAILGKRVGDTVTAEIGRTKKDFEIVSVV